MADEVTPTNESTPPVETTPAITEQTPPPTPPAPTEQTTQDATPAPVVPEKYEFPTMEGLALDPALAEKFTAVAKAAGLTQDAVNGLSTFYGEVLQQQVAQAQEAYANQQNEWKKQVEADPVLGGKNHQESMRVATEALGKFGSPELKQFLTDSGVGNHPEIIRLLHQIGSMSREDQMPPLPNKSDGLTGAQAMFPSMKNP